jgi:hypothetical protein
MIQNETRGRMLPISNLQVSRKLETKRYSTKSADDRGRERRIEREQKGRRNEGYSQSHNSRSPGSGSL